MKLLILEPCLINHGNGQGGEHTAAGFAEVASADTARALVASGKALYTSRKDDPNKAGANTATPEEVKIAEAAAKVADKSADKAADKVQSKE